MDWTSFYPQVRATSAAHPVDLTTSTARLFDTNTACRDHCRASCCR